MGLFLVERSQKFPSPDEGVHLWPASDYFSPVHLALPDLVGRHVDCALNVLVGDVALVDIFLAQLDDLLLLQLPGPTLQLLDI